MYHPGPVHDLKTVQHIPHADRKIVAYGAIVAAILVAFVLTVAVID